MIIERALERVFSRGKVSVYGTCFEVTGLQVPFVLEHCQVLAEARQVVSLHFDHHHVLAHAEGLCLLFQVCYRKTPCKVPQFAFGRIAFNESDKLRLERKGQKHLATLRALEEVLKRL